MLARARNFVFNEPHGGKGAGPMELALHVFLEELVFDFSGCYCFKAEFRLLKHFD